MSNENVEDRIEELEMKVTFQDQLIEDLNQSLIQQQLDFRKFTQILENVVSQVENIGTDNQLSNSAESPPPHY
ncbi:MAG: SlyX protein [Gammaproteobacteria bacterium]|nr:MAG: SlyX protein [Gammaproteobacteria bacterium]